MHYSEAFIAAAILTKVRNQAGIDLLQQWREEDAAMTEAEKEQADRELEEFKRNMNANRAATGEELVY